MKAAVPVNLLEELAAMAPTVSPNDAHYSNGSRKRDAGEWLAGHGLEVSKIKPWQGGTLYELQTCPWNREHRHTAHVIQHASGALSAACFHNSCGQYGWRDLKEVLGDSGPRRSHQAGGTESSADNGNASATASTVSATVGLHLTDLGNAKRLVARHGQDLRYVKTWGCWLCWDRVRWRRDATDEIVRRAKETVCHMYAEAASQPDEAMRKRLAAHAMKSESDGKIRAMIRLAQSESEAAATPDQFDSDPWAFNVLNGTLDLRTGLLRPHDRHDLITKLAPIAYNPQAVCPIFTEFLNRIFAKNPALIAYLQRALGSALSGAILDHVLHILYGMGANGKTTLMNIVLTILGEYAAQAAPDLLVRKHNDPHPTEVADLWGVRFAACTEAEEGARLAEVQVKRLTGGDRLKARYMRQDFFQFEPTFTIFLSTNHRPTIKGTDFAIWRRIRLIPFSVTIPEQEQDRLLAEKLKGESAGILAWMVEGCLAWQRQGLGTPPEVGEATRSYKADMDLLAEFLESCCVMDSRYSVTAKELYAAYRQWAEEAGEWTMSQKALGSRLTERGFDRVKPRGGWVWRGIALRQEGVV